MTKKTDAVRAYERNQVPDGHKMCSGPCATIYPTTEEHFDRDSTRGDGFKAICKQCRSKERALIRSDEVLERIKRVDKLAMRVLDESAAPGSMVPHTAELYESLISAFGGVGGFTQHCVGNYLMMAPGSHGRSTFLRDVLKLGMNVTDSGKADIPIDLLTDEDLDRLQNERLKRLVVHIPAEDVRHLDPPEDVRQVS